MGRSPSAIKVVASVYRRESLPNIGLPPADGVAP